MASDTGSEIPCPDPSAHIHHNPKLSEQASTAALYVTSASRPHSDGRDSTASDNPLGPDGKLSSKSAATSLKYAKPQDLPSFPSVGNTSNSSAQAAMLAKDYKMKDLWQPEQSLAGSKAALAANKKGAKLDLWEPSASKDGMSAAKLAVGNKTAITAYSGVDADAKSKALLAATMSVNKGRSRATSTPQPVHPAYPDSHNSASNALNAATVSHRNKLGSAGWDDEANQAARITNLYKPIRSQFGDNVEYDPDPDDTRHQAALKASAVSMAKRIYESQNRSALTGEPGTANVAGAQAAAANRGSTTSQPDLKQQAMQYISLQDAAHKLAAERLAKIDKDGENARFRDYYGYGDEKPKKLSSRLSMRSAGGGRQHNRASSDGGRNRYDSDDSDDEVQAQRIRTQMSQLSTGIGQVDQKKQQDDRAKLLAAAEKRVSARMHTMDEKVLADTGKMPNSLMEAYEAKARERAMKEREEAAEHPGKTHVGGGKFMANADIEAVAAARLKPTLDQLNENAEKKRAIDEENRLAKEEQEREKREKKQTDREEKERIKKITAEEKAAEKARKDEEKARKAEEKRLAQEEKRKSREQKRDTVAAEATGVAAVEADRTDGDEADAEEDPAVTKHRSALGRLKDRFKKGNKEGEETEPALQPAQSAEVKEERPPTAASTTAVASGIPGNTTSGGTATDGSVSPITPPVTDEREVVQPQPLRPQQTERSAVLDHDDDHAPAPAPMLSGPMTVPETEVPLSAAPTRVDDSDDKYHPVAVPAAAAVTAATIPTLTVNDQEAGIDLSESQPKRPGFEQHPSLSYREETDHASNHMPELERHISAIPDSDSSDDEWSDHEEEKLPTAGAVAVPASSATQIGRPEPQLDRGSQTGLVGGSTAGVTGNLGQDKSQVIADRATAAPVTSESERSHEKSLAQPAVESEHAEPVPSSVVKSTGAPTADSAASIAHNEQSTTATQTDAPTSAAVGVADGNRASIDEKVARVANTKFGTIDDKPPATALATASSGQPKEPAGPDPKPAKLQKHSGPVEGVGTTVNPSLDSGKLHKDQKHTATGQKTPPKADKQEKEGKGFRGLFNKLRHKESKDEKKYPEFKSPPRQSSRSSGRPHETKKAGDKPVTTGLIGTGAEGASATKTADTAPKLENVDTGPTFGTAAHASTTPGIADVPDSPSSFRRGESGLADPDDVSSSGADEDDVTRGRRTGPKKMGFGRSRTTRAAAAEDGKNSSTEDEAFEEARDHFDETLAPPPAFAGQAKSESPSRGTKFQEQL